MRKIIILILILSVEFFSQNILADNLELIPLKELKKGMNFEQIKKVYSDIEIIFKEENNKKEIINALLYKKILDNTLWDAAIIDISEGKIQSWSLVKTKDFDQAQKNVPLIISELIHKFGENFSKAVAKLSSKQGSIDSPVLIWDKGDILYAFISMPFKEYKSGDVFKCQLSMFPREMEINKLFNIVKKDDKQKETIFKDIDGIISSLKKQ